MLHVSFLKYCVIHFDIMNRYIGQLAVNFGYNQEPKRPEARDLVRVWDERGNHDYSVKFVPVVAPVSVPNRFFRLGFRCSEYGVSYLVPLLHFSSRCFIFFTCTLPVVTSSH